jgi:arylsulfatase A-like enzyme
VLTLWVALLLACSRPSEPQEASRAPVARERRVIVLVILDGLRRDRVGIYGGKGTPTLDRFATRSTVFDEARTVSPATQPALRALLSGRAPDAWSDTDHLGTQLAAAGWTTALLSEEPGLGAGWSSVDVREARFDVLATAAKALLDGPGDLFLVVVSNDLVVRDRAGAASYDQMVGEVDGALATLLDPLGAKDVAIVTSAHGEELGEHGAFGHGHTLYEELVHVPLLVRARGMAPGRRADTVSLLDVAPTIRAIAGVPAEPSRGHPLLMLGAPRLVAFGWVEGATSFGSWFPGEKWIYRDGTSVRFDLRADPKELQPIATTDAAERRARIVRALGAKDSAFPAP